MYSNNDVREKTGSTYRMMDEVYAYSELTDTWYRVHDYEEVGSNGRIVANGKTEVDEDEVPEHWKIAIRNNADSESDSDGHGGEQ